LTIIKTTGIVLTPGDAAIVELPDVQDLDLVRQLVGDQVPSAIPIYPKNCS